MHTLSSYSLPSPPLQLVRKPTPLKKLLNLTDQKGWQGEGEEEEEEEDDVSELQRRVHTAKLPTHARKAALKEIKVCVATIILLAYQVSLFVSPSPAAQDTTGTLSRACCVEVSESAALS